MLCKCGMLEKEKQLEKKVESLEMEEMEEMEKKAESIEMKQEERKTTEDGDSILCNKRVYKMSREDVMALCKWLGKE